MRLTRKILCSLLVSITFFAGYSQEIVLTDTIPESSLLLSEYIQIESVSGNEAAARDFLANVSRQKGFYVELPSLDSGIYNLSASIYPLNEGKPNIILLSHMDVVPPGPGNDWAFPAFSGEINDGRIFGRGTVDMKGMAIMQLLAMEEIKALYRDEELPINITLLAVSGEEKDNRGAKEIVKNFLQYLNPIVVFGEGGAGVSGLSTSNPSQVFFAVSNSEKKALWLELLLKVESSAHGSVPPREYANSVIVRSLNRLLAKKQKIKFDQNTIAMLREIGGSEHGVKSFILRKPRLFKSLIKPSLMKDPLTKAALTNTISVTGLKNPSLGMNQIPQEVLITLDCRLLPATNPANFIQDLRETLGDERIDVRIIQETPTTSPSPLTNYYKHLSVALKSVYKHESVIPVLFPAYSDNSFFREQAIPVYGINPVALTREQLESVHGPNEYITVQQMERGTGVYIQLLRNIVEQESILASRTK